MEIDIKHIFDDNFSFKLKNFVEKLPIYVLNQLRLQQLLF